jgi:hypothetical protein
MKRRCHNPSAPNYNLNGGHNISVCERWRNSFEALLEDMGPRPSPEHTLDRIDNDGPYSPDNCRWSTIETQSRNIKTNVFVLYRGERVVLKDAIRLSGCSISTYHRCLKAGLTPQEAIDKMLETPPRRSGRPRKVREPAPTPALNHRPLRPLAAGPRGLDLDLAPWAFGLGRPEPGPRLDFIGKAGGRA